MTSTDMYRQRLDSMIDLKHPLAVLSRRLPWGQIEVALAPAFERRNRAGRHRPPRPARRAARAYLRLSKSSVPRLCLRANSLIGIPASTCRRKPMICSSLYLLVLMSIILRVDGLLGKMTGTVYGGQVSSASI